MRLCPFEVSVLVESSDERILLTRRAAHMRAFPGVWVPPGGVWDKGESVSHFQVMQRKTLHPSHHAVLHMVHEACA